MSEKNTFNEIIYHSFFANEPGYNHRIIIFKNIIKTYINKGYLRLQKFKMKIIQNRKLEKIHKINIT